MSQVSDPNGLMHQVLEGFDGFPQGIASRSHCIRPAAQSPTGISGSGTIVMSDIQHRITLEGNSSLMRSSPQIHQCTYSSGLVSVMRYQVSTFAKQPPFTTAHPTLNGLADRSATNAKASSGLCLIFEQPRRAFRRSIPSLHVCVPRGVWCRVSRCFLVLRPP